MSSAEVDRIRTVRSFTGAGVMACKEALASTGGDVYGAIRQLMSREQIIHAWRSLPKRRWFRRRAKDRRTRYEIETIEQLYADAVLPQHDEAPTSPRNREHTPSERNDSKKGRLARRDPLAWLLREEARSYDDSQQDGRPRRGVTWFATDSVGQVAELHSRESGYIPLDVFANTKKQHLLLYEHFVRPSEEEMEGDAEIDAPRLGLFFYDIVKYGTMERYDRMGIPDSPLPLSKCPAEIQELLLRVQLDGVFADTPRLIVRKHWKCI